MTSKNEKVAFNVTTAKKPLTEKQRVAFEKRVKEIRDIKIARMASRLVAKKEEIPDLHTAITLYLITFKDVTEMKMAVLDALKKNSNGLHGGYWFEPELMFDGIKELEEKINRQNEEISQKIEENTEKINETAAELIAEMWFRDNDWAFEAINKFRTTPISKLCSPDFGEE